MNHPSSEPPEKGAGSQSASSLTTWRVAGWFAANLKDLKAYEPPSSWRYHDNAIFKKNDDIRTTIWLFNIAMENPPIFNSHGSITIWLFNIAMENPPIFNSHGSITIWLFNIAMENPPIFNSHGSITIWLFNIAMENPPIFNR